MKPAQKRAVVRFFQVGFHGSERRVCRVAGAPRSTCRYRSVATDQAALRIRLRGQPKVNAEALLVAAGQNLKRLLSEWGWGRRQCPGGAAGVGFLPAPAAPAAPA